MNQILKQAREIYEKYPMLVWVALALVLMIVILAIVLVIVRKRRQRATGQVRQISSGALKKVWKTFLRQIPADFRRHVLLFQPFVVFGESGAGKSLLIGKYTDWKGQAAQFYPSFAADPQLMIYLGSRALVQEVPSTLLADTSPKVRTALLKVWRPLFKKRDPIVIITISAAALKTATPESLRTQAQMMRGKINVLSRIADKPIKARIVLTHMDQGDGYVAFSEFVEKQEIPHQIKLDPRLPNGGLETCLEPFEAYLSLALVTLPAKSYLKILTFLNKAPETFQHLGIFLRTLKESDPLSYEPEIEDLYLTSDTSGSPSAISNPFNSSWADQSLAMERSRKRKHRIVSTAIVLLGLAYLGGSFAWGWQRRLATDAAVKNFETNHDSKSSIAADLAIWNFDTGNDQVVARTLLLDFFPEGSAPQRKRFLQSIRTGFILPKLDELAGTPNAQQTVPYALGVLYASKPMGGDSPTGAVVGTFVLQHLDEIADIVKMPPDVISVYVKESNAPWTEPHPLVPLAYRRADSTVTQLATWNSYLIELDKIFQRHQVGSTEQLEELRKRALKYAHELADVNIRNHGLAILKVVEPVVPNFDRARFEDYRADATIPDWLIKEQVALTKILDFFGHHSSIHVPELTTGGLAELTYHLQGITALTESAGETLQVSLSDTTWKFNTQEWDAILGTAATRALVDNFIHKNQSTGTQLFFPQQASGYATINMQPPANSDFLYPGKGQVDGRYTRLAYDNEVKPQVLEFQKLLGRLHLESDVMQNLENVVQTAAEKYASEYEQSWHDYYDAWQINGESMVTTRVLLTQMRLPTSRFQDFLQTVKENTAFVGSESSSYLRPINDKMESFHQINELSKRRAEAISEIEKYRSLLSQMLQDLDAVQAAKDKPKEDQSAKDMLRNPVEFAKMLQPEGKLSLAIIQNDHESYLQKFNLWLDSNKLDEERIRRPFLQPVLQMHKLGLENIKKSIAASWDRRVHSQAVPLFEKFPFNRKAVVDSTPLEVQEVLFPSTGLFWVAFRNLIAPVCLQDQGEWKPLPATDIPDFWPENIFTVVNHLQRLTDVLWDPATKNPKELILTMQPQDLPKPTPEKPAVILSFLTAGKNSVFGFNQKLLWQDLKIQWWLRPPAEVGLQAGNPDNMAKTFRTIREPESAWSVFRLLEKDIPAEANTWVWNLPGTNEAPGGNIKFVFKSDPWELFNVPTLSLGVSTKGVENEKK